MKSFDVVAVGASYIDLNASGFPFDDNGIPIETEIVGVDSIEEGYEKIIEHAPALTTIVKDGASGAIFCDADGPILVPAQRVEKVIEVTGAGDAFNAGVIAAILRGREVPDAVRYGCDVEAAKISMQQMPRLS